MIENGMIKLLNPPCEFADDLDKFYVQKSSELDLSYGVDLEISIGGVVKKVRFRILCNNDREIRLISRNLTAYCQVNGGKLWPTSLMIDVMTKVGRSRDAEFPARAKIPNWFVFQTTVRLNKTYPIRGWWDDSMDGSNKKSKHNTYSTRS